MEAMTENKKIDSARNSEDVSAKTQFLDKLRKRLLIGAVGLAAFCGINKPMNARSADENKAISSVSVDLRHQFYNTIGQDGKLIDSSNEVQMSITDEKGKTRSFSEIQRLNFYKTTNGCTVVSGQYIVRESKNDGKDRQTNDYQLWVVTPDGRDTLEVGQYFEKVYNKVQLLPFGTVDMYTGAEVVNDPVEVENAKTAWLEAHQQIAEKKLPAEAAEAVMEHFKKRADVVTAHPFTERIHPGGYTRGAINDYAKTTTEVKDYSELKKLYNKEMKKAGKNYGLSLPNIIQQRIQNQQS